MSARLVVFTAVVTVLGTARASHADKIYVTDFIPSLAPPALRMSLDGSDQEALFGELASRSYAGTIAVDSYHARVYIIANLAGVDGVYGANLDGTDLELLVPLDTSDTFGAQMGVDVDPRHQKVYWAGPHGRIFRIDASGGTPEFVQPAGAMALAVDPSREQVYWLDSSHRIYRAQVAGGAEELIAVISADPFGHDVGGIALDLVNRNIYWVSQDERIGMVSMDGGEVKVFREGRDLPIGVAVDAPRGHFYWTRGIGQVVRANLDGTGVTVVAQDLPNGTWGIALQLDCGNGRIDPGETCDVAIDPGWTGECVNECFDSDPCTSDEVTGLGTCSARCEFETITEPIDRDGCCPNDSFTLVDDSDCTLSPWPDVPTVSTWGAVLLSLLLAVGITLKWRSHQTAVGRATPAERSSARRTRGSCVKGGQ